MAEIPVPFTNETPPAADVQKALPDAGTVRLAELADDLDAEQDALGSPLFELAREGEVALFPVGNHLMVRTE